MLHQGSVTRNAPAALSASLFALFYCFQCRALGQAAPEGLFPLHIPCLRPGASLESALLAARGCRAQSPGWALLPRGCSTAAVPRVWWVVWAAPAASSEQGTHWEPHAAQTQPGHQEGNQTQWLQHSHTRANDAELASSCLFTYLFWMCQKMSNLKAYHCNLSNCNHYSHSTLESFPCLEFLLHFSSSNFLEGGEGRAEFWNEF